MRSVIFGEATPSEEKQQESVVHQLGHYAVLIFRLMLNISVSFGVVSFWRGAWNLFGLYVYPDDFWRSTWLGLIVGVTLVSLCFILQPTARKFYDWLSLTDDPSSDTLPIWRDLARGLFYRLYMIIMILGVIWTWRGWWQMWDHFVLVESLEKSNWVSLCTGLLVCSLFYSLNSLVGPPGVHFNDKPKFAFTYNLFSLNVVNQAFGTNKMRISQKQRAKDDPENPFREKAKNVHQDVNINE